MIRTEEQAQRVQLGRYSYSEDIWEKGRVVGQRVRRGVAKAVRRFYKRHGQKVPAKLPRHSSIARPNWSRALSNAPLRSNTKPSALWICAFRGNSGPCVRSRISRACCRRCKSLSS